MMNTRRRGSAASAFAAVTEEGSDRSLCGPPVSTTMCSKLSIFCGALSSRISKSAAVRSCTGTPFLVAYASTRTRLVSTRKRGGGCCGCCVGGGCGGGVAADAFAARTDPAVRGLQLVAGRRAAMQHRRLPCHACGLPSGGARVPLDRAERAVERGIRFGDDRIRGGVCARDFLRRRG